MESRAIRELCRNCKCLYDISQIHIIPEQVFFLYSLLGKRGYMEALVEARERYACSTRTFRELGRSALSETIDEGIRQEAFRDFRTALVENMTTDPEFGEFLDYNPLEEYQQADGLTLDTAGRPITPMIEDGLRVSREAARFDDRMKIQAYRDESHVVNSRRVDEMPAGTLRIALDMDPRTAIAVDPDFWQGRLGYRRGLASLQLYYKTDRGTVLAGAYSIKNCSPSAMREMFAELGCRVPEGIADEEWFRHAVELTASEVYAKQVGVALQQKHRRLVGDTYRHISVTDFLKRHHRQIESVFNELIVPLGIMYEANTTNKAVLDFTQAILSKVAELSPNEKGRLMRLAHTERLQKDDISFLEELVRYGLVEQLRPLVRKELFKDYVTKVQPTLYVPDVPYQMLAMSVSTGRQAGRVYGGCASAGMVLAASDAPEGIPKSQNIFGGRALSGEDEILGSGEEEKGPCEYVHENCYCCPYNYDGTPALKPFKVKARRELSGDARCLRAGCGAVIDSEGKVKNKGGIYERAIAKQAA